MSTVRGIIQASLRRIGVLAEGETPTAHQAADGLESLNALLDQWAADRLQVPVVLRTRVPLSNGIGGYRLAPVTADAETYDGFDTAWTVSPPDWTMFESGDFFLTFSSDFQSSPRAVLMSNQTPGTDPAAGGLYRDIVCSAGTKCSLSIWLAENVLAGEVGGTVTVQNIDNGLYLDENGNWGTTAVVLFTAPNAGGVPPYVRSLIEFYLDPTAVLGDTLRFTLGFESTGSGGGGDFALFDTFDFINYADVRERPVYVDHVNVIDGDANGDLEIPLSPMTDDGWAALRIKPLQSALPTSYHYNPTFPYGTLHVYPVPDRDNLTLIVYAGYPITKFQSTTNTFYLPPGYERMIVTNLALELAPEYNKKPSELLFGQARDSMDSVKRSNYKPSDLRFDAAILGSGRGWYSIRTG